MGSLTAIWGPMMAGKSTRLIAEGRRLARSGFTCVFINHSSDADRTHCAEFIVTHDRGRQACVSASALADIDPGLITQHDVILVNEGQFFRDLAPVALEWVRRGGKTVIVAGLATNYLGVPFPSMATIIACASHHIPLRAVCVRCVRSTSLTATCTGRIAGAHGGRAALDALGINVGGADTYVPLCSAHFFEHLDVTVAEEE